MSAQTAAVVASTASGNSGNGGGTTITPPENGIWGWVILPAGLYNRLFNSTSSTSSTNSIYTMVNGYPTINGNYYDCKGNIDNDMAHHSTNAGDTDPGHHVGQNCSGGSPSAPSMAGMGNSNSSNNGVPAVQWLFVPGTNNQWVIIPLNAMNDQILWETIH